MLRSFRTRLLAGFAIVITLSLLLSAAGFTLLLREQQARAAEQRIGLLVEPLARRVSGLERSGWPRELIRNDLDQLASYYDIRILLLDWADRVVLDTDPEKEMLGHQIEMPVRPVAASADQMQSFRAVRFTTGGEDLLLFTPTSVTDEAETQPRTRIVIAVPAADVTSAWAALLPSQALAGGGAAIVAVIVAVLLASRITTPIAQMTRASEAMAAGDLNQRVGGEGVDEIGTLARAFNEMSAQVSRSNRAMRDLVANVSHDLRTPLTSIQGFSQALVDGMAESPAEASEMAAAIHGEAERMRVLVNDLIELSQIEGGTIQLSLDGVHVDRLVEATARRLRLQAEEAGVGIRLDLEGGVVIADGRRVEQVLTNLLDNALRFAPAGSDVLVRTRAIGSEVVASVQNGGTPIPAEHLPYLFDRFYQADDSRSGDRHSGLGLSIVRELVQAHEGSVGVRSDTRDGTVFSVRLPVAGPRNGVTGGG